MNRNLNRRIHPIAEADGLSPKKNLVTREEVERFLSVKSINGESCGSGDGYGYVGGFGYGSGYGYGDGYCYGYRYGSGDGYGYGSGYSSGYGTGSGHGDGYCYGSGYGESGYGCGVDVMNIKTFNGHIIDYIDGVPTIITHIHNNVASGFIIGFDMTLIPCYVRIL